MNIQMELYYDKELKEEVSVDYFESLVAIHGIDKVSDWIEVVTIPDDAAQA